MSASSASRENGREGTILLQLWPSAYHALRGERLQVEVFACARHEQQLHEGAFFTGSTVSPRWKFDARLGDVGFTRVDLADWPAARHVGSVSGAEGSLALELAKVPADAARVRAGGRSPSSRWGGGSGRIPRFAFRRWTRRRRDAVSADGGLSVADRERCLVLVTA